jgi:hypothetical protein
MRKHRLLLLRLIEGAYQPSATKLGPPPSTTPVLPNASGGRPAGAGIVARAFAIMQQCSRFLQEPA